MPISVADSVIENPLLDSILLSSAQEVNLRCPYAGETTETLDPIAIILIHILAQSIEFPKQLQTAIDHSIKPIVYVLYNLLSYIRVPSSFTGKGPQQSLRGFAADFQSSQANVNSILGSAQTNLTEIYLLCSQLERVTNLGQCRCRNRILESCIQLVTGYNKCTKQLQATIQELSLLAGTLVTSFPLGSTVNYFTFDGKEFRYLFMFFVNFSFFFFCRAHRMLVI